MGYNTIGVKVISQPWEDVGDIPYYLIETYDFYKVVMDDVHCVFAEPRGQMPTIESMTKHFLAVYATASVPVVLKANGLSGERRKALMEARIPFAAPGQIYLPFMGIVLQKQLYREPKLREKLMPSAQMLMFAYLYQNGNKMYTSPLAERIGVSLMQITRAVRQLERLGLFEVAKDGVQVVIKGKTNHRALFESAEGYLIDPVRDVVFVPQGEIKSRFPYAGISALSEITMLSAPDYPTYAYYSKTDKLHGESGLIDPETQARVEIWKYSPTALSMRRTSADPLSVIVSLKEESDDERVEQAINDVLRKMWG